MAQDFKKGTVLVDGHGNFGSIEGDGAAAMRYTEARLAKITQEAYLQDLDKDIVNFVPNFDETEKEPEVLPVRIPNLLVNGAEGIAVGMATSIPTHNLGEVIDGVKAYMKNNEISTRQLMKYIKGPDFPTGGIVVNKDDLLDIYETGTGKVKLRGKVDVEELKGGKSQIVISEIPYTMIGAGIGKFLNDVYNLVESKKTSDITDISNQSSKEGIRIVIELKKGVDAEKSHQHALQEDPAGGHLWGKYAGSGGRTPGDHGLEEDHRASCGFPVRACHPQVSDASCQGAGQKGDPGGADQSL